MSLSLLMTAMAAAATAPMPASGSAMPRLIAQVRRVPEVGVALSISSALLRRAPLATMFAAKRTMIGPKNATAMKMVTYQ